LECFCPSESSFAQAKMALEQECSLDYFRSSDINFSLDRGGFSFRQNYSRSSKIILAQAIFFFFPSSFILFLFSSFLLLFFYILDILWFELCLFIRVER